MQKNRFLFLLVKWIMPAIMVILIGLIAFLKPTPKAPGIIQGVVSFKSTCPPVICLLSETEIIVYRPSSKAIVAKTKPDTIGSYTLTLAPAFRLRLLYKTIQSIRMCNMCTRSLCL
jgi:hypothetical protein